MAEQEKAPKRKRRDWIIILIIILIGFLCVIFAGGWAIRFSPTWKMDTDMGSNIDPDSVFLTSRPSGFLEPLDPSILTQPVWINVFLTPGASFLTSAPATLLPTNTPLATNTPPPTVATSPTTIISFATNTLPYFPPPTNTPKPPLTQVDLQITKTDGVTTYIDSGATTYTIVVTNAGPNAVNGATITDNLPAQITSANWTCIPSGGATCTANGSGNLNQVVNMPVSSTVTYTVAATIGSGVSGNMTNTVIVSVPTGYADPNTGNNSATDTNNYQPTADLQITKSDGGLLVYKANDTIVYTIIVSNNGPDNTTGGLVSDNKPPQVDTWDWACTTVTNASGCVGVTGSSTDFSNTVDIQNGGSIEYTVTAYITNTPSGDLTNTATVTSTVYDSAPGNNSAADTNALSINFGDTAIGNDKDSSIIIIPPGSSVVLTFGAPLMVNGHPGFDLIYYELPNGTGIAMDLVILQIGNGFNWYTILNWGDNIPDTNTNNLPTYSMDISVLGGLETDNRNFTTNPGGILYNSTGITIELDGYVPNGTYPYIRIISPSPDSDGGVEVDAIYVVP